MSALVDVHVHFLHDRCGRADWAERNRRRIEIGDRLGITIHIASILGSFGQTSPTYFPSPEDVSYGNQALYRLLAAYPRRLRGYVTVNPNFPDHALKELAAGFEHLRVVGVKLAASRRASDRLLDPIAELAADLQAPVLQHVWQHRHHEVPGQEISDALDLAELAARHPRTGFILAHIGGGGDWAHSLRVLVGASNVWVDLSGSGVDRGMLEMCLECVGPGRLLWGSDLTLDAGIAKLRALEAMGLDHQDVAAIRWKNASGLFRLGLERGRRPVGRIRRAGRGDA